MSITSDAIDLLNRSGSPTASFKEKGTTVKGTIVSIEKTQQQDYATKTPKTWDNGDPMWQLVITLNTAERDADIEGDNGDRRVFAKGQMIDAVREAFRTAGAQPEVGGTLAIQYDSDGTPKNGMNPPKHYIAAYEPPKQQAIATNAADLLG